MCAEKGIGPTSTTKSCKPFDDDWRGGSGESTRRTSIFSVLDEVEVVLEVGHAYPSIFSHVLILLGISRRAKWHLYWEVNYTQSFVVGTAYLVCSNSESNKGLIESSVHSTCVRSR